jgi:hypothetical protein
MGLSDMKRLAVFAYLAVATPLLVAAPVNAGKPRHKPPARCDTHGGRVMAADTQAILYRNVKRFEFPTVYGCAFTRGHSFRLGEFPTEDNCGPGTCGLIDHETLAGPLVAYEHSVIAGESGEHEEKFWVIVRDLRDGRVLHRVPTGVPFPPSPLVVGNGPTPLIVLKSDGSVAWITADFAGELKLYEVHALDKTGSRVLATGSDIDPHSLALAGSTLYWTQAGKPYSTRLN